MLQLFSKNHFLRSLLLLPLALVLQIPAFIKAPDFTVVHAGFLSDNIAAFTLEHPVWSRLILVFIFFLNAVLLNRVVIINRMSLRISLFPGAVYIALTAFIPAFGQLSIIPMLNLVFILLFGELFYTHKRYGVSDKIFNVGLYTGIITLLYPPALCYLILAYVALLIMRAVRLKENLNLINGLLLPYYLFAVYLIWIGKGRSIPQIIFEDSFALMNIPMTWTAESIISASLLFLLPLISFFRYGTYIKKKSIQVRKKIDIFFWALLITLAFLPFHYEWNLQYGLFLIAPLSFLFSESLMRIKNTAISEGLYFLVLVWGLISNFVLLN